MKIRQYILAIIFAIICIGHNSIFAQEALVGLGENARIPKQSSKLKRALRAAPLTLPFIDDFAKPTNYLPDRSKWTDNNVFINTNFGIDPPTIGVATFDAFDKTGKLYPAAGPIVFAADTLTTQAINMSAYHPADSIYLSFFFQPKGHGDMPEPDDVFIVQFLNDSGEWVEVWSASANVSDSTIITKVYDKPDTASVKYLGEEFYRAHFKIDDPAYYHPAFQFRFINYVSISSSQHIPGISTTYDHWHLDFVYLNKDRFKTVLDLPDVTLAQTQQPISTSYESIPATHLNSAAEDPTMFPSPMNLSITYRTFYSENKSVNRNFRIAPLYGTGSTRQIDLGSENIYIGQTVTFETQEAKYNFTTTDDSAAFMITSYIKTDTDPAYLRKELRYNDTSSYIHYFRDYYAYDDGTAEAGYGIDGNNTANAKVAIQFESYQTDSLRGVYMYFNHVVNNANVVPFNITVWSDYNGQPDRAIYMGRVDKPVLRDSLNKFVAYKFDKAVPIEKGGKYYVGWTQISETFLNIGFDLNRTNGDKLFYN